MGALWLPSDDELVVAQREPNLLVPGRKPTHANVAGSDAAPLLVYGFFQTAELLYSSGKRTFSSNNDAIVSLDHESVIFNNDSFTFPNWSSVAGYKSPFNGAQKVCVAIDAKADAVSGGYVGDYLASSNLSFFVAISSSGHIYASIRADGVVSSVVNASNHADSKYYKIVVVYDGAALSLYIDGTLRDSTSASGVLNAYTNPLTIGGTGRQQSFTQLQGNIRSVAIWVNELPNIAALLQNHYFYAKPANDDPFALTLPAAYPTLSAVEAAAYSASSITPRCDIAYP